AVAVAVVSISQAPFEGFAGQTQPAGLRLALWTIAVVVAGLIGVVRKALLGHSPAGDQAARAPRPVPAPGVPAAAPGGAPRAGPARRGGARGVARRSRPCPLHALRDAGRLLRALRVIPRPPGGVFPAPRRMAAVGDGARAGMLSTAG